MPIELKMPSLSPTMEKGTLARWLVSEGDQVNAGDLIAEIETDKAMMEIEAPEAGRIAGLMIPEGSVDVPVGTVIALFADESEDVAAPVAKEPALAVPASAVPPAAVSSQPKDAPQAVGASEAVASRKRVSPADRVRVSPLALRIAEAKGIDLEGIVGTGPNGRIVRADLGIGLKAAAEVPAPTVLPVPAPTAIVAPPPAGVPVESTKLSSMRRTIARRLSESKQTVPHFYLTARCNLDPLLKLRQELNASLVARGGKLSVNDMLMKVMALALVDVPAANVQFGGDELHRFSRVDISMAVAIEGGLVTPIIRDVASLSLSAISGASRAMAAKARDGKLLPDDYQGGTASISNLGMFGIDEMFPVINPPQALILGVGAGIEQPWKVDGTMALATIMAATGSFDHRAIDGATAAQFLAAFRERVESPMLILG